MMNENKTEVDNRTELEQNIDEIIEKARKTSNTFILDTAKLIKMIETLLLSVLIIAIALALLCVKLLFRKHGEFSSQHIHDSKAMKDRGIHCVMDQDREARQKGGAY